MKTGSLARVGVVSLVLVITGMLPICHLRLLVEEDIISGGPFVHLVWAILPLMFFGIWASGFSFPYEDRFCRLMVYVMAAVVGAEVIGVFGWTLITLGVTPLLGTAAMITLCVGTLTILALVGALQARAKVLSRP
jgi:hypothetical protein